MLIKDELQQASRHTVYLDNSTSASASHATVNHLEQTQSVLLTEKDTIGTHLHRASDERRTVTEQPCNELGHFLRLTLTFDEPLELRCLTTPDVVRLPMHRGVDDTSVQSSSAYTQLSDLKGFDSRANTIDPNASVANLFSCRPREANHTVLESVSTCQHLTQEDSPSLLCTQRF